MLIFGQMCFIMTHDPRRTGRGLSDAAKDLLFVANTRAAVANYYVMRT
jgi:hypothetical protein